jgi:CheY-like chemotaxis protein
MRKAGAIEKEFMVEKAAAGRPLVLMVDDDPDFQTIVRDWLKDSYEHIGLADGEELINEIDGLEPNLVILDVRMPGPDGFKLCEQIRSDRRFSHLPVLFLTGCKEDEDFMRNLSVGGTAYLTKPVTRKRLLSTVKDLLEKYS